MVATPTKALTLRFSLLRLSGLQRACGAMVLVGFIWLGVVWALRAG